MPGTIKDLDEGTASDVPAALAEDWKAINVPPKDNGCVICGAGGEDVIIGDTPKVTWRCRRCNGRGWCGDR